MTSVSSVTPASASQLASGGSSLQERTGECLRNRVLAAEPGERFSEVALAREFGVSRSLLRQKAAELVAKGLLVKAAGRGIFVTENVAHFNTLRVDGLAAAGSVGRSGAVQMAVDEARTRFPKLRMSDVAAESAEADIRRIVSTDVHALAMLQQPVDPVVERYPDLSPTNYQPEAVEIFRHEGSLLALPLFYSAASMLCNRRLFEEAGLSCPRQDWTWEDMIGTARALHGPERGQTGIAIAQDDRLFLSMIWSFGGDVFAGSNQRWHLRHAAAYRAASLFARLRAHGVVETWETERTLPQRFMEGRVAMWPTGGAMLPELGNGLPTWAVVAPMPRGEKRATWVYAEGVGLGRACRGLDMAAAFIHGLSGATGQQAMFNVGLRAPGLKSIGEAGLDESPFLSQMPWARVCSCVRSTSVRGLLRARLAGLTEADVAEAFCRETEDLINGVLSAQRHGPGTHHG